MVAFSVHFYQLGAKFRTCFSKQRFKPVNRLAIEHLPTVFRHKHQVDVQVKNAVSARSDIVFFSIDQV